MGCGCGSKNKRAKVQRNYANRTQSQYKNKSLGKTDSQKYVEYVNKQKGS